MTDTTFRASGYALMIEENEEHQILLKQQTVAPVAFGLRVFSTSHSKLSKNCKEFLAKHHEFPKYSHFRWNSTQPTRVLTDNRSVTRLFSSKICTA